MHIETKPTKRYHTVKEVAAYLGLSGRQVYKLIEEDRIPVAIRLARAIRLDLAAVESALLKTGRPGPE